MTVHWMARRRWYYLFSGTLILLGLLAILLGGLKPALEFTGGSQLIVRDTSNRMRGCLATQPKSLETSKDRTTDDYSLGRQRIRIRFGNLTNHPERRLY